MSEKLNNHEHIIEPTEFEPTYEKQVSNPELLEKVEAEVKEDLEKLRDDIEELETESKINEHVAQNLKTPVQHHHLKAPDKELRDITLRNYYKNIRRHLSLPNRTYSRLIHNSKVDKISEVSAKTIARPYAFLFGGLFSLIGSSFYLYYVHHTGYQFNYFLSVALFILGFIVGIVIDVIIKIFEVKND